MRFHRLPKNHRDDQDQHYADGSAAFPRG
jgi:hypothetical protein